MAIGLLGIDFDNPDFVNEKGVKWWAVRNLNERAMDKSVLGISMPGLQSWLAELPSGERNYVLVLNGEPMAESQSLETIAAKLDMIKMANAGGKP